MTSISSDVLSTLNTKSTTSTSESTSKSSTGSLDSEAFLTLLVTQMQNQNPLDPQDNTEYIAQLAQLSTVEGINNLNTSMTSLTGSLQSSQAVSASALVGQTVQAESSKAVLTSGGTISGVIDCASSTTNLGVKIYSSSGELVYSGNLGSQSAGEVPFVWDGTDGNGKALAGGTYKIVATATDSGQTTNLTTYLSANVNSVTVGTDKTITLNLDNDSQVSLSEVKNFL